MAQKGRKAVPVRVQEQYRDMHRSNAELEARREAEASIQVSATDVKPPKYMTDKKKRKRFRELATMLQEVDAQLCTELDVDALAAYVDAQFNYEFNQRLVDEMHLEEDVDTTELERRERIRNAAQAKADKLRTDLLLEPASRARTALVKKEEPKENPFTKFTAPDR